MKHCRYHCRRCRSHFTSLKAFDAHHGGTPARRERCAFPDAADLRPLEGGTCTISSPPDRLEGVTVYELAGHADQARERAKARRRW